MHLLGSDPVTEDVEAQADPLVGSHGSNFSMGRGVGKTALKASDLSTC